MENNTTVADCVADCVEASSGLLDDIEMVLVAGGALLALAAWGYKKYKSMMADGKITLDELLEAVDETKDKLEEAINYSIDYKGSSMIEVLINNKNNIPNLPRPEQSPTENKDSFMKFISTK